MKTQREKLLARRDRITAELKIVQQKIKGLTKRTCELSIEKIRINQKLSRMEGNEQQSKTR